MLTAVPNLKDSGDLTHNFLLIYLWFIINLNI